MILGILHRLLTIVLYTEISYEIRATIQAKPLKQTSKENLRN